MNIFVHNCTYLSLIFEFQKVNDFITKMISNLFLVVVHECRVCPEQFKLPAVQEKSSRSGILFDFFFLLPAESYFDSALDTSILPRRS